MKRSNSDFLREKLEGLQYLEVENKGEKGYKCMWVEHGTANPNARGFWNKYFLPYQYELVRTINR